jgi:(p)ppGpp synthase/HD superfamily hydrolase
MRDDDRARLVEALRFALDAHGQQTRKGSRIPYASHLLQVAGLVLEHGGDALQAAAAVLHDVVEDCEAVDDAVLRERFGAGMADLHADGVETLTRFEGTPEQTRGYYEAVNLALAPELPHRLIRELDALLDELRRFVPSAAFASEQLPARAARSRTPS